MDPQRLFEIEKAADPGRGRTIVSICVATASFLFVAWLLQNGLSAIGREPRSQALEHKWQEFECLAKRICGVVDFVLFSVNNSECVEEDRGFWITLEAGEQLLLSLGQLPAIDERHHREKVLLFLRGRRLRYGRKS